MSTDELRSVSGGFGIGIVCAFPIGFDDPIPICPAFSEQAYITNTRNNSIYVKNY